MSNQTQYNEATQSTDAKTLVEVYRDAALRSNDHLVLVGMLGTFLGFFSETGWRSMVNSVAVSLGRSKDGQVPDSVVSPMRTLFDAVIPGYVFDPKAFKATGGRTREKVLTNLCEQVDVITKDIFGDTDVEYATLRRAVQCGGILKSAITDDSEFPVAKFLHDVLAARQSNHGERNYCGDQTGEMLGAVLTVVGDYDEDTSSWNFDNANYPGIELDEGQILKADHINRDPAGNLGWTERVPAADVVRDQDSASKRAFERVMSVLNGTHILHEIGLSDAWRDELRDVLTNVPDELADVDADDESVVSEPSLN